MRALLAGLTTLDVIHALDHEPDLTTKTTSCGHLMAAGGPATNAAVTVAALEAIRRGGGGASGGPAPASPVHLLTAVGEGMVAEALASDLAGCRGLPSTRAQQIPR